jgi:hypothetical protein
MPSTSVASFSDYFFLDKIIDIDNDDQLINFMTYNSDKNIRVMGTLHSFGDIISSNTDTYLRLSGYNDIIVNKNKKTVTVGANVVIETLLVQLAKYGLTIPHRGHYDKQRVIGALVTGTHGTGAMGTIADGVEELTFYTYDLNKKVIKVVINKSTPDFESYLVNFGCIGVITSVTLECVDEFYLNMGVGAQTKQEFLTAVKNINNYNVYNYFPPISTYMVGTATVITNPTFIQKLLGKLLVYLFNATLYVWYRFVWINSNFTGRFTDYIFWTISFKLFTSFNVSIIDTTQYLWTFYQMRPHIELELGVKQTDIIEVLEFLTFIYNYLQDPITYASTLNKYIKDIHSFGLDGCLNKLISSDRNDGALIHPTLSHFISMRFLEKGKIPMAMNYLDNIFTLSIFQFVNDLNNNPYAELVFKFISLFVIKKYKARPHLGKLNYLDHDTFAEIYPEYHKLTHVLEKYHSKPFVNKFMSTRLYNKTDLYSNRFTLYENPSQSEKVFQLIQEDKIKSPTGQYIVSAFYYLSYYNQQNNASQSIPFNSPFNVLWTILKPFVMNRITWLLYKYIVYLLDIIFISWKGMVFKTDSTVDTMVFSFINASIWKCPLGNATVIQQNKSIYLVHYWLPLIYEIKPYESNYLGKMYLYDRCLGYFILTKNI